MKQSKLREFKSEMTKARQFFNQQQWDKCFYHLENAHVLGQRWVLPHTASHYWMLKVGIKKCDFNEIFGQLLRIVASLIFSRIWVPSGNTGGANVSARSEMPVREELLKFFG